MDLTKLAFDEVGLVPIEQKNQHFAAMLRVLGECRNCSPLTPLECISRCKHWRLKNEMRRFNEIMENPNFMKDLMNVLKNDTRLVTLMMISKGRCSVGALQDRLRKAGESHSQGTIIDQYLRRLLEVGLVAEAQNEYYATTFGVGVTELVENSASIVGFLPKSSECYEENILMALLGGPKTYEDMNRLISQKIISRILKRLKTVNLIKTPRERDYIFFFKSKRDPDKETLISTEKRVYDNIPEEGISVKRLAERIKLSKRRTYKHIRHLKGTKLVFFRKRPKVYRLTSDGEKVATFIKDLRDLVETTLCSSQLVIRDNENSYMRVSQQPEQHSRKPTLLFAKNSQKLIAVQNIS